jgi:type 2 lantibiotic biosynthesis protein LanM
MSVESFHKKRLLDTIAALASTPKERLRQEWVTDTSISSIDVQNRLQRLCKLVGAENEEKEKRLLDQLLLGREQLIRSLSLPISIETTSRPGWVSTLEHILLDDDATSTPQSKMVAAPRDICLRPEKPLPFEELLLPFVHYAREQLLALVPTLPLLLSLEVQSYLERWLLVQLGALAERVLQDEFTKFRQRHSSQENSLPEGGQLSRDSYNAFLAQYEGRGLFILFIEYCTLARLLILRVEQWIEICQEFLQHLEEDRKAIEQHFQYDDQSSGPIVEIEVEHSDPHHNGRSVFILRFSNGHKLVYKPRCLEIDRASFRLFDWLDARGLSPNLKGLRTLSRATHGWMEYIEHLPCKTQDEVQRYYQRVGQLVCLFYALQASDMHFENTIANGEYPIPIDLETIITPPPPCTSQDDPFGRSKGSLRNAHDYSVRQSTLLPMQVAFQGKSLDLSFLGCVSTFDVPIETPHWKDINTDTMRLVYEAANIEVNKNVVIFEGSVVKASDYLEDIIAGFRTMYGLLTKYRDDLFAPDGPLAYFAGKPIRYVFRSTFIYEKLLYRLTHSLFLRDGVDRWIEMQIFKKPLLKHNADPQLWTIIDAEVYALARLDVPRFTALPEGTELIADGETTIANAFDRSALDQVRACLAQLSVEDLERQIGFIRDALTDVPANASVPPVEAASL